MQQLINGLSLGAVYALIALGYTMVYGVLRFINFAHGDVFMVGAFSGMYLSRWLKPLLAHWPEWLFADGVEGSGWFSAASSFSVNGLLLLIIALMSLSCL